MVMPSVRHMTCFFFHFAERNLARALTAQRSVIGAKEQSRDAV